MRFNPILSIILGAFLIIVALVVLAAFLGPPNFNNKLITGIFIIAAMLILLMGGFVATYFAMEYENKIYYGYKIRYAIYLGLILAIIETIGTFQNLAGYKGIGIIILYFVLFSLITGIGGFIAKMTERSNRQLFSKNHLNNGLSPTLAIVVGFIVAYLIVIFLELITGTYQTHITSFGIFDFIIGATSIAIGTFVTIFLGKEKKIQYGIYLGIIISTISLLDKLYINSIHYPNFHENYLILTVVIVGYLFFAVVGSYIGVIVDKHLNKKI